MTPRIGIVGGGIAGLVAGHELTKAGAEVTLFEREARLGGQARSFVVEPGLGLERYYHFICRPDGLYLDSIAELGLASRLRWQVTQMGLFHGGILGPIGDPLEVLRSPHFVLAEKLRLAWATATVAFGGPSGWRSLENVDARSWLVQHYGQRVYDVLYEPLLRLKFHDHAASISAAWMWARFHRLGKSRTLAQREYLGCLEGGTQVYIDALEAALRRRGAQLALSTPVDRVLIEGGRAIGVSSGGKTHLFDAVLMTVPIPYALSLLKGAGEPYQRSLSQLEYIDVVVIAIRLRHRFSRYFWLNVSDPGMNLAGIVEHTNLSPRPDLGGDGILYLPHYLPDGHPLHSQSDEELFDLSCRTLTAINPAFEPAWVRGYWVHRDKYAQPICDVGFSSRTPSIQTPVDALFVTDSCQLHPYDRSISGSTGLGKTAAHLILARA